jgi:hypothetical protein
LIHAIHLHADQTLNATMAFALACLNIKAIHTEDVDLNVSSTVIVTEILHV